MTTTTQIINLTPHAVNIIPKKGPARTFEPSGQVARLKAYTRGTDLVDGLTVPNAIYGSLEQHIEMDWGTYYIVSLVTALACKRQDFLFPFEEVRDVEGRIIGCRRLARVAP